MIGIGAIGIFAPLISIYTYHRAGVTRRSAVGLAVIALLASLVATIVLGFVYGFGITVSVGLCGDTPWEATAAAIAAYAIAGSWAMLRPRRWWMWPLATGGAVAAGLLVSYFFASAHAYCET